MLYSYNLQKQTRIFFKTGGGGARRAGPGSAFAVFENRDLILMHVIVSEIMWVDHIDSIITT